MWPLNSLIEKSLLPIDGKPAIRHIYDNLRKSKSIGRIFICCLNKFAKQFKHEFRDTDAEFCFFENPLGTARTIIQITENKDENIMIHYADCMTDIDYDAFISLSHNYEESYDGMIAVTDTVKSDYGAVMLSNHTFPTSRVTEFSEKPVLPYNTWSGILIINQKKYWDVWEEINGNRLDYNDIAYNIFPYMVEKGKLGAYNYHGFWADVGNLNSYRKVCELYNNSNT